MNVLVISQDEKLHSLVADALSWVGDQYLLTSTKSLTEARSVLSTNEFRVVLVGPDLPEDTLAALVFLRGKLPYSSLLSCMKLSKFDRESRNRLLETGVDLVFDQRMSATQLALVLRPYFKPSIEVHTEMKAYSTSLDQMKSQLIAA